MEGNDLKWSLNLPHSAPHSLIAKGFSMKEPDSVFIAIKKLYLKYIDPNEAMLAVNLAYKVRKELEHAIRVELPTCSGTVSSNRNVVVCEFAMPLLERAAESICHLMKDSYTRYRRTESFGELVKARSTSI